MGDGQAWWPVGEAQEAIISCDGKEAGRSHEHSEA